MDEEERVKNVNKKAVELLTEWMEKLDEGKMDPDDLLAISYGSLVTTIMLGYNPEALLEDAKISANKIMNMAEEVLTQEEL